MTDEKIPWQLRPLPPRAERAAAAFLKWTVALACVLFIWNLI